VKTQSVQLGEVCKFVYGEALKEENRRSGKVPVYGSNGVVGWHDTAITGGATIVIGRKGSIGEVNWSDGPCFPIDTTYYLEKTERPCDLRWLYYTLLKLDLTRLNKSAAVPGLNRDDAYEQRIPFPDVSEQRRIAERLEQADRLRRTRRYALELTDTFLPAAFLELFGDPTSTTNQCKMIPLKDVTTKVTDGVHLKPEYTNSGIPFISVKNITTGQLRFEDCMHIRPADHEKLIKRCKPEYLDVLYTKVGATYGRAALVDTDREFSIYVSVCLIKPNRTLIVPEFLNVVMNAPIIKRQADQRIKGIGVPDLHLDQIREFLVPLPPVQDQRRFAALVERVERLRAVQREALRQAEHLFASLLHRAFRAEL
jgi:type I restriction enzyme, S subunit